MRVPDADLPDEAPAPAPWDLRGSGCILLVGNQHRSGPDEVGGPGLVMFVDYAESPVGPYQEVLYIPGRTEVDGQRRWRIQRIYVSTWASVVNGRRNWGIPKDRADFEHCQQTPGRDRYSVTTDGLPVASLEFSSHGPALPFPAWLTPPGLRGLTQDYGGQRFSLAPEASGRIRYARVREFTANPETFAALDAGDVQAAVAVPEFRMRFPVASVQPLHPAEGGA